MSQQNWNEWNGTLAGYWAMMEKHPAPPGGPMPDTDLAALIAALEWHADMLNGPLPCVKTARQCIIDALPAILAALKRSATDRAEVERLRDKHHPDCDALDHEPSGIVKPCNCILSRLAKLQAFKDWAHAYLDRHGVPHHPAGPHGAEGCRIGDRMDWLMAQRDELAKALEQIEQMGHYPADLAPDLIGDPERDSKLCDRLAGVANDALSRIIRNVT